MMPSEFSMLSSTVSMSFAFFNLIFYATLAEPGRITKVDPQLGTVSARQPE